ncbi:isochorismate synthase [Mycolicibacterium mengxianglii]|uniref:isochorismate synthase n=1 Tax=Mycolicibacterium mengxianglii TaxID=2736649 RepID=UPI0027DA2571|nr:isochorismate synthase [Mycolicibacterium mengxianglii]
MSAGGTDPSFVLSGPAGTVVAEGLGTPFADVTTADEALRRRSVPIVVGALPFDLNRPAALHAPERVTFTDRLPEWPSQAPPEVRVAELIPSAAEHRQRVANAVARLQAPAATLQKVVLARAMRVVADSAWDPRGVLSRLHAADPAAYGYLVDLTPAGAPYLGSTLVGASPELLVARIGDQVRCRPFAGSAPRATEPEADRANGAALAASGKNRHEHRLVVEVIRDALAPLCTTLDIDPEPQLHHTDALWHLSTRITGTLRRRATTAMDLAVTLHPTPAVGGHPTDEATSVITELEGDRGFYAGAAGWCDADGDGRWVVAIRCAQLSADRRTALAHSGGGIVAESDPLDELDETTTKFRTIMTGLGAPRE